MTALCDAHAVSSPVPRAGAAHRWTNGRKRKSVLVCQHCGTDGHELLHGARDLKGNRLFVCDGCSKILPHSQAA